MLWKTKLKQTISQTLLAQYVLIVSTHRQAKGSKRRQNQDCIDPSVGVLQQIQVSCSLVKKCWLRTYVHFLVPPLSLKKEIHPCILWARALPRLPIYEQAISVYSCAYKGEEPEAVTSSPIATPAGVEWREGATVSQYGKRPLVCDEAYLVTFKKQNKTTHSRSNWRTKWKKNEKMKIHTKFTLDVVWV